MGGRGRRRPQARNISVGSSSNSKDKSKNRDNRRRGSASSSSFRSGLFVEGGALDDWQLTSPSPSSSRGRNFSSNLSKSQSLTAAQASSSRSAVRKPTRNVFAYQYPAVDIQEGEHGNDVYEGIESQRVILLNSKKNQIVAFMDEEPSSEPHNVPIIYDYTSDMVLGESSHRGLGFHDTSDSTPSGVEASSKTKEDQEESGGDLASPENDIDTAEEMTEEVMFERSSTPMRNAAYLSIEGRKFYTEDLSGEESDERMAESGDDESLESSDSEDSVESSESSGSDEDSDSGSEIDQDVLEDYLEGIGGGEALLDSKWLLHNAIDESDDSSGSSLDETLNKLSGIALQDASKEYGIKKPSPLKQTIQQTPQSKQKFFSTNIDEQSSAIDDLFLFKDRRSFSARKNHAVRFPQSWPMGDQKSKRSRSFPGEKKKYRKELIAVKRRDRMIRRGVDLEKINMQLEQIVVDGIETHSFEPMHSRDCSQIQRLAAIYQLRTLCLNSGKKRFVMVERTQRTCMPSSSDKLRIEKLIGAFKEDADFPVVNVPNLNYRSAGKRSAGRNTKGSNSMKNSAHRSSNGKTSNSRRVNLPLASNPVSFVSCGIIESDIVEIRDTDEAVEEASGSNSKTIVSIGAFEEHTTGFGSKMMAKMGFIEGKGLGKDGGGMAKPIEVIKRPKSLGLGMNFSEYGEEESSKRRGEPHRSKMKSPVVSQKLSKSEGRVGSFERHRQRKDEGKVGSFEKHTKGFGSRMMAKMGFVEGEGLGRDSQGMVNPLVAVRRPKARGLGATTT